MKKLTRLFNSSGKMRCCSIFLQINSICFTEIMRCLIFFWRKNEALWLVTSGVILLMLFLQWKHPAPHSFFRKYEVRHYFFKKNEVSHYFFRKKWSASLFLQQKMRCLIITWEKMRRLIIPSKKTIWIFFWRNNEALHFFLKK